MKIRVYFICLLILFAFSSHTGLAQNHRDLTYYDNGGVFDFSWGDGPEAHAHMRPKLRRFLWEQWTQKRLAHKEGTFNELSGSHQNRQRAAARRGAAARAQARRWPHLEAG